MQELFDTALDRLTESRRSGCRVLLAVSGGVDSMTMATLFLESGLGIPFAVAHVNFSLRGEESDGDEALVRQWCGNNCVQLFVKRFETSQYASKEGISIEMAARELRYSWFEELCDEEGFDYVAVAHNLNDCVETMYLNLVRGTGLRGLAGIRQVSGRVIRPMASFTRSSIEEYAVAKSIEWRNDSSNLQSIYSRNRIRNAVIPQFEKINPSFLKSSAEEMNRFSEAQGIIDERFEELKQLLTRMEGNALVVDLAGLLKQKYHAYWLFRIAEEYGFNSDQVSQMDAALSGQSGKTFYSDRFVAVKDRNTLRFYPLEEAGCKVTFREFDRTSDFNPADAPEGVLFVDADKVLKPLRTRPFAAGDRFIPLGMKGSRLVSDFLTDLKLDVYQKRKTLVVTTADENGNEIIVAVAGHRIDDRYKITSSTKRIIGIYSVFSSAS